MLLLCLCFCTYGQIKDHTDYLENSPLDNGKEIKSSLLSNGETWYLDSSYYYGIYSTDWEVTEIERILSRDEFGNSTLEEVITYNPVLNQWKNTVRVISEYNEDNHLISVIHQEAGSTKEGWVNNYKYTYTYGAEDYLMHKLFQDWDESNGDWLNKWQKEYTYNSMMEVEEELYQEWDIYSHVWVNHTLTLYDVDIIVLEMTRKEWDAESNQWVNYYRVMYDYGQYMMPEEIISQYWYVDSEEWVNFHLSEYEYDDLGYNTLYQYAGWEVNTNEWIYYSRVYFEFNENNREILLVSQVWDADLPNWVNDYQRQRTYNENNQEVNRIGQNWINEHWVNYSQTVYTYENERRTGELYQVWDAEEWGNSSQYLYTFNQPGYRNVAIFQQWDANSEVWINKEKWEDFWNKPASINVFDGQLISLYPNPVNQKLNLKIETEDLPMIIEVYDLSGKLVLKDQLVKTHQQMDVSDLDEGVYLVRIDMVHTAKLIVQH